MRTTPEAIDLQATFRAMLDAGDRACAMEVSSHALELRRVDGVHFAVAAFTNLSQDHLDFHPDMESYFAAKLRLFEEFDVGRAIVVDRRRVGPAARRASSPARSTVSLERPADWQARRALLRASAATRSPSARRPARPAVELPLRGRFNAANALVAMAAGDALGLALERDGRGAADRRRRCPGACRRSTRGRASRVLVDYAHKPGALEKVLLAARELATGRVIVVFGAGGDRDRAKRPLMGEIAARLADRVIVTSDNPRSEPPEAIIDEILAGVPAGAFHVERDRRPPRRDRAARSALAEPGDVVVIAGKGHEQGQEFAGGRKEPFDDVEVAREALRAPRGAGGRRAPDRERRRARHEALDRPADRRRGRRRARARRRPRGRGAGARRDRLARDRARRPVRRAPGRAGRRRRVRGRRAARRRLGRARRARRGRARPAGGWPTRRRRCSPPSTRSPRSARSRAPGGATSPRT